MPKSTGDDWMGTPEAARYLGVTQRTLYKLIDEEGLRAYRSVGSYVMQGRISGIHHVADEGSLPGLAAQRRLLAQWLDPILGSARCHRRARSHHQPSVPPHAWHRMLNADVPQHIVQRWLDHDSPAMTAHYARLADTTMRKHYEGFRSAAVNIRGELVGTAGDDAVHDAEWMKERLSRAKETLPDGFCGRPLQKTCPHPNACHTCDDFLTTAEFLPQHRDQLSRTRKLIAVGEANGQLRLVESNRQIEQNLVRMIQALEPVDAQG